MNPFICISLPFICISLPKEHERRNGRGEREQSKGDGGWGSCQRVWACTHTRLHRRLCPAVRDARACACALMVRASARARVCLVRHTHGLSHFPLRKGHHLPPPTTHHSPRTDALTETGTRASAATLRQAGATSNGSARCCPAIPFGDWLSRWQEGRNPDRESSRPTDELAGRPVRTCQKTDRRVHGHISPGLSCF